jgi:hypothetical protein
LRAAQAYMLISMPTGTSTIFGAFQAIRVLQSKVRRECRTAMKLRAPRDRRKHAASPIRTSKTGEDQNRGQPSTKMAQLRRPVAVIGIEI